MGKLGLALRNPSKILPFLEKRHHYPKHLLEDGDFLGACFFLPYYVSDRHYFDRYLALKSGENGLIETDCLGISVYVKYDDTGIGHELYITGCHEPHTTEAYRAEVRKAAADVDAFVVLDIGANIGYWTLVTFLEAPTSDVYAIEPVPSNVELLAKNIRNNGFSDSVRIFPGTISAEGGSSKLYLSDHSNHASINTKDDPSRPHITVDSWTIQSFLETNNLSPTDVNVIRMDVEGYEAELLAGSFATFLDNVSRPFLLNIELHPKYIDDERCRSILEFFDARFELVAGYQHSTRGVLLEEINELDEILERDLAWVELILRK